jgi:hypothetical protein
MVWEHDSLTSVGEIKGQTASERETGAVIYEYRATVGRRGDGIMGHRTTGTGMRFHSDGYYWRSGEHCEVSTFSSRVRPWERYRLALGVKNAVPHVDDDGQDRMCISSYETL